MSYDLRFLSTHVSTKYQCFLLKHFQLSLFQVTLCTLCSELDPRLHSEAKVWPAQQLLVLLQEELIVLPALAFLALPID